MSEEEIKNILLKEFRSIYCDSCGNIDTEECDYCDRKSMGWTISDDKADKVAREVLLEVNIEQLKWERDVAIQQLKDLGYGFGEQPIYCCSCKYGIHAGHGDSYICTVSPELQVEHAGNFYCGYSERREDD